MRSCRHGAYAWATISRHRAAKQGSKVHAKSTFLDPKFIQVEFSRPEGTQNQSGSASASSPSPAF
eukprot:2467524-Rhodomonas_salina.3